MKLIKNRLFTRNFLCPELQNGVFFRSRLKNKKLTPKKGYLGVAEPYSTPQDLKLDKWLNVL